MYKKFIILLFTPLLVLSCQSFIEPIINDAAEKAVKEYGNSNPLAERVVEVEKIVEVPVEKIIEVEVEKIVEVPVEKIIEVEVEKKTIPTPTPVPIIKKSKNEIDQYWECKEIDDYCLNALGKKDEVLIVTGNTSYEIELYFTSGYEPSELIVNVDFCYPILINCWSEGGNDGYGSLIAQPQLNDYRHAEEKWVPAVGKLTWDGTIIRTSKIVLVTPKNYVFRNFDPVITITDPEGKENKFNLKNWKVESFTD